MFLVSESGYSLTAGKNSDNPFAAQLGDLGRVVAEALEDLVGVLAEQGGRPAVGAGRLGELDRGRRQGQGPVEPGVADLVEQACRANVRVVKRLLRRIDLA